MLLTEKTSWKGYMVWMVCVCFYFYEFLLRTILGTFQSSIMSDLHLSPIGFALLSSTAYLFVYGVMQVPVGTILLRFGLKKSMVFASIVCCVANLGFAYSHNYYSIFLFRALMGLGSSFGFISLLVALYDWMPYRNIALYVGLSQLLGTMGPMLASGPLNTLAQNSSVTWRTIFIILSCIGLLLTLLITLIVDNNKQNKGSFLILSKPKKVMNHLAVIIKQPQIWLIALFCSFIYFSIEYLSENECKNFLMAKGFSSIFSSYMITTAWLGFALGSPIFGYISDRISRRKFVLLFSAAATFLALFFIIYLPLNKIEMFSSFFLFGIGVGASSVGIVTMGEQLNSDNRSIGLGLNNASTILFVAVMAPLIEYLLMYIAHQPLLLADYQLAFGVLVFLPLAALGIAFFGIKETYGKSTKEKIILNY